MTADLSLLGKVAQKLGEAPSYADSGVKGSILTVSATSYGFRDEGEDEVTQPTGFDPHAAALFESVVESAFLVANADGVFDDTERAAFLQVVSSACGGSIAERQVAALLADLADQLEEDGLSKRIEMVARTITRPEHAREVLRIAGLIAHVSEGVSAQERDVLEKLTSNFQLKPADLDTALNEVERALGD